MKMKTMLVILVLFLIHLKVAFAEPPPGFLKDGKIEVTLRNGSKSAFSANEWKVVPRHAKAAPKAKPPETSGSIKHHVIILREKHEGYKNTFVMHAGGAPGSLRSRLIPGGYEVSPSYQFTFGVSLSRQVTDRVSIMGTYLTNQTGLLGIGVGF